jgi:Uncharacterized conserved domain (SAYSvFN)
MPPRGFKRSRALWDQANSPSFGEVSQHDASSSSQASAHRRRRRLRVDKVVALARAVGYELQLVRASQLPSLQEISERCRRAGRSAWHLLAADAPRAARGVAALASERTGRQWCLVAAVAAYYGFVRYMHEWLNAGPVVLIFTLLAILFTVGLGDTADGETLSAYSVFNRGVRLLGDVNVDDLMAQHVGGAGGAAGAAGGFFGGGLGGGGRMIDPDDDFFDDEFEDDDDDDADGNRRGMNRGRRPRHG